MHTIQTQIVKLYLMFNNTRRGRDSHCLSVTMHCVLKRKADLHNKNIKNLFHLAREQQSWSNKKFFNFSQLCRKYIVCQVRNDCSGKTALVVQKLHLPLVNVMFKVLSL